MKTILKKFTGNKLYLLAGLIWLAMSTTSCTTYTYYCPNGGTFSGNTNYCQGATAAPDTFTYTECMSGDGSGFFVIPTGASGTVQWYYNTTGATTPGTSTALGSSSTFPASTTGGTISYTPLTTTIGTFYYFAQMTWSGSAFCSTSYITPAQTINVSVGIAPITGGESEICMGGTTTFADTSSGGTWSTGSSGIASVSSSGVVTPVGLGSTTVNYTVGSCTLSDSITVNELPIAPVVTPATATICDGSNVMITASGAGDTINLLPPESWESGVPSSAGTPVDGWHYVGSTSGYWLQKAGSATASPSTGGAEAGSYVAEFNSFSISSGASAALESTVFSLVGITGATLKFWVWRDHGSPYTGATYASEGFNVYINTTTGVTGGTLLGFVPRDAATAVSGAHISGTSTPSTSGWYEYTCTIPASYSTVSNYIIFNGVSKFGDNAYLDNVTLTGFSPLRPTWSPATYLYTDAAFTVPYAGSNTDTVYMDPSGLTTTTVATYSATATTPAGCTASGTSMVTVYDPTANLSGDTTICDGGSTNVILTGPAGAVVSYNINGGSTLSATIGTSDTVVLPTGILYGSASYNLLSVTSGSCSAALSDSAVVTVTPATHTITGDSSVCTGLTTVLADTPSGGTWTDAGTGYATVDPVSGTVTGVSAGTEAVSYIAASTGCISTTTVTVNPSPSPLAATTVCQASFSTTASGSETVSGGTWSISDATVATVDAVTGTITGVAGGSATVTYTLPAGCFVTGAVTVNPLPVSITGPDSVCQGLTTTLSDTSTSLTLSGTWSSANALIASVSAPGSTTGSGTDVIRGVSAGTTTITYTLMTGCYTTASITVNPSPAAIGGPAAVCAGSEITLSNPPTTGGSWSAAPSSFATIDASTGILTGITAGTTVVTYTLPTGGCMATYSVTVNPLPTAITGTDSVCAGLTTTLSSTPTGGTWTAAPTTIATVGAASGIVRGISSGTVTVTYTLSTGCTTDTTVMVNPSPAPITGLTAVCAASAITLTDTPTTGGTWSAAPAGVATIDSVTGVLSGLSAGTSVVTYSLPPGGCITTVSVTVNPLPSAITGADSVCAGLTTALSSGPAGGTWSGGPSGTATVDATSGIVTGIAAGSAGITYTLGTGCEQTYSVTVNPLPGPVSGPSAVCAGLTITFTDDTLGGSWSTTPAGTATIDGTSGILTGVSGGTATVTYTVPTGCIATDVITVNPLPAPITGADNVCYGLTTVLTDATGGGTWSSSDTTVATIDGTGTVTGIAVGTATITYTLGTGCIETLAMTVNPLPLPITGPAVVCVNASITMSDITMPGTWSTVPGSIATIDGVTGVLTGVSAGTVTVVYTLPTSCMTQTVVTVNPIPDPIGGTLSACEDDSTSILTEAVTGGTWSITPASVATISPAGTVTGLVAGSAVVTYTLPVTGCYITAAFTVNPLPFPINGTQTVCAASTVTLHDPTFGGTWSDVPPTVATVNTFTGAVTGISAGTATVSYTLGTGCAVVYTMTVDPQPASVITPLGDTMLCPGGVVALTANTGAGLTYQWYDGGAIGGATASSYIASAAGSYKVRVTNDYGCSLVSAPVAVSINVPVAVITSASTVTCSGTALTLFANTGAGLSYQWQLNGASIPGAVASTYNVTDSSGNYTVVVSNTSGCSQTSNTINVTVNPTPVPSVTESGALTFCDGGSVLLTADAGYSYQWFGTAAGFIPGANSMTYAATASDNYYVQETNGYGCAGYSAAVPVIAIPLSGSSITTSGPVTFCSGGSVVLSAPTGFGYTYQWYNNGVAVSGATDASYTDTASGNFTVVVTNGSGCADSTPVATSITSVTTPAVTPLTATSFCWGGGVTLSVNVISSTGGVGYQWYYNGSAITGATNALYSTSVPGNYSCLVTAGACNVSTATVPVTEFPLPNPLITFDGAHLHTGNFYVTYQWYRNLVAITGATDSVVTATDNGNYAVAVTDSNGCQSVSDLYVLSALGVNTVNGKDIHIYPNPARTLLHVVSPVTVRAEISGMDGRRVLSQDQATDIDISSLADGIYLVRLYDESGILVKTDKLVKASN